jgi:hypothetical protein
MVEESEELWLAPEISCVEAEIALQSDPPNIELARSSFDKAIKLAQQFRAPGIEARCKRARARLLAEGVELAS